MKIGRLQIDFTKEPSYKQRVANNMNDILKEVQATSALVRSLKLRIEYLEIEKKTSNDRFDILEKSFDLLEVHTKKENKRQDKWLNVHEENIETLQLQVKEREGNISNLMGAQAAIVKVLDGLTKK